MSISDLEAYRGRLKCLDNPERDLLVSGSYDTAAGSNIMLVFEKCSNATASLVCKSKEEIDSYLNFKYILAFWNSEEFIQGKFGDDRIERRSKTHWFPLDSFSRTEYVMHIMRTHMQFEDS